MATVQENLGSPVPPDSRTFETSGTGFSRAKHSSCHPTNTVKTLKKTQPVEERMTPNHWLPSFFIRCLIPDGMGVLPFMPAVQCLTMLIG